LLENFHAECIRRFEMLSYRMAQVMLNDSLGQI
jgi:hypothetical protein